MDDATITKEERQFASSLADREGDRAAADQLGVGLESLLRILGGRRVREGTMLVFKRGVAAAMAAARSTAITAAKVVKRGSGKD